MFGNIIDGKMHLSPIGEIALAEWEKSFDIRPNLFCDAFVIMPNHIHAILRIDIDRDAQLCVSTKSPNHKFWCCVPFAQIHFIVYGMF